MAIDRGDAVESITMLLEAAREGHEDARARLFETMYGRLRRLACALMADEPVEHTLQPTALVNEAFLRLVTGEPVTWNDQRHFVNSVTRTMRHILVDRARRKRQGKRGGGWTRVRLGDLDGNAAAFPEDRWDDLDGAMRRLEAVEPRWAEVTHLRFLAELKVEQTAAVMGVSAPLVKKDWRFARAWLVSELNDRRGHDCKQG